MTGVNVDECLACPSCRVMTDKETNFCTYCGADNRGRWSKIAAKEIVYAETVRVCGQCGTEYKDFAIQYCPDDGKMLMELNRRMITRARSLK
jgi:hypothetical protein